MIGIIDYGSGNVRSVQNALERIGARSFYSGDPDVLAQASRLILPGVGSAGSAMRALRAAGLVEWLPTVRVPLLGICLGMQILFEHSSECDSRCLGIIPGGVERFGKSRGRVPHTGWNQVLSLVDSPLLRGLGDAPFLYFVHSYHVPIGPAAIGSTDYGGEFASAVNRDNYWGVQFHPEKSGATGLKLLQNFLELC